MAHFVTFIAIVYIREYSKVGTVMSVENRKQ